MGNFITRQAQYLFTDHFGSNYALRLVGNHILREVRRSLRQMLSDFLHQSGEFTVIQCGNRYNRRKFIQLIITFHNLEQLLLIRQFVNFIYYQNYRCFYLLQQVQDIILACAAFFGCIHYKEDNVNLL